MWPIIASGRQFKPINGSRRAHLLQIDTNEEGEVNTAEVYMRYGPCNCTPDESAENNAVMTTCLNNFDCLKSGDYSAQVPMLLWQKKTLT